LLRFARNDDLLMTLTETAYAKINLALHVRRRREDGYHELETLFAFVDAGDTLAAQTSEQDQVSTVGEFAGGIDDPFDNLVAKALSALPRSQGMSITLEKNLPVAAGLGGGSADAGAVFRLVERLHGLPGDWQTRAAKLGADVPCCVRCETVVGRGTGTELEPIESDLTDTPVLLVNPREPLSTGPVFNAWDGKDRGGLPCDAKGKISNARNIAINGRNDLTEGAISLRPSVREVLHQLNLDDPWLTRMSGSGATCFALYDTLEARDAAAERLSKDHPEWWQLAGKLR
jgi:4-diphosphocytidyl-2-C-methyl-D-erythritol kinase